MRKFILLMFTVCLCMICTGCAAGNNGENYVEENNIKMGTICNIKIAADKDKSKEIFENLWSTLDDIEKTMSAKIEDSELSYVNNNAINEEVVISEELYYVIEKSLYYAELTEGAFDPAIGNIIDLWKIGTDEARVPEKEEIEKYLGEANYKNIVLNKDNNSIRFLNDKVKLDLGGIVKGYAADRIKEILINNYNISSGYISLGGNVMTIGKKTDGSMFKIGIQSPYNVNKLDRVVEVCDKTVVTSGDYERFFIENGIRYHHIIDPATGEPARSGVRSVTIITSDSIMADAISTACFVMGEDKAKNFIEKLNGKLEEKDYIESYTIKQ
ncbi:MAG: FAD:protein FMN transferase [Lachnospiraceae bacterium]|nr:FAD:protein FMN transferase [Lachnospiraceae bacterium]